MSRELINNFLPKRVSTIIFITVSSADIKSIKFVSIDKYGKEYPYYKIYIEYEWINNIKTILNKYYDKYDFKLINEKEINKLIRKKY